MFIKKYLSLLLFSIILVEVSFPVTLSASKEKKTNTKKLVKKKEQQEKKEIKKNQKEKKQQEKKTNNSAELRAAELNSWNKLSKYFTAPRPLIKTIEELLPAHLTEVSETNNPLLELSNKLNEKLSSPCVFSTVLHILIDNNFLKNQIKEAEKEEKSAEKQVLNLAEALECARNILKVLQTKELTDQQKAEEVLKIIQKYQPLTAIQRELNQHSQERIPCILNHTTKKHQLLLNSALKRYKNSKTITPLCTIYEYLLRLRYHIIPGLKYHLKKENSIPGYLLAELERATKNLLNLPLDPKTGKILTNIVNAVTFGRLLADKWKMTYESSCKKEVDFAQYAYIMGEIDKFEYPASSVYKSFQKPTLTYLISKGADLGKEDLSTKFVKQPIVYASWLGAIELVNEALSSKKDLVNAKETDIDSSDESSGEETPECTHPLIYFIMSGFYTTRQGIHLPLEFIRELKTFFSNNPQAVNTVISPKNNNGYCVSALQLCLPGQEEFTGIYSPFQDLYLFYILIKECAADPFIELPCQYADIDRPTDEKKGSSKSSPLMELARTLDFVSNTDNNKQYLPLVKLICKEIERLVKEKSLTIPKGYFSQKTGGKTLLHWALKRENIPLVKLIYRLDKKTFLNEKKELKDKEDPFEKIGNLEKNQNPKKPHPSLFELSQKTEYLPLVKEIFKEAQENSEEKILADWLKENIAFSPDLPNNQPAATPPPMQQQPFPLNNPPLSQQPLDQQNIKLNNSPRITIIPTMPDEQPQQINQNTTIKEEQHIKGTGTPENPSSGQWKMALAISGIGVALFIAALLVNHYKKDVFFTEVLKGWLSKKPIKPLELASPQLLVGYQQYTNGTLPRLPLTQLGIVA